VTTHPAQRLTEEKEAVDVDVRSRTTVFERVGGHA
jgi:hypothetical protein